MGKDWRPCRQFRGIIGEMERDQDGIDHDAAFDEWLEYVADDDVEPNRRWGVLDWVAIALAVVVVVGVVALWPTGDSRRQVETLSTLGVPSEFHSASVTRVEQAPCLGFATVTCVTVDFELTAGPDVGTVFSQEFGASPTTPEFAVGDTAVLSYISPNAVIREMLERPCAVDTAQSCVVLSLVMLGEEAPEIVEFELFPGDVGGSFFVGAEVVAQFFEGEEGEPEIVDVSALNPQRQYQFADFLRRPLLVWLAIAFAVVVIALGRWRGAAALGGLIASVGVLLVFVLPAILDGRSPVLVAVFGAAAIAFFALYAAHGFNRMTTVALLGTLAALTLTALLSAIVVGLAGFTGFTSDEASLLSLFDTVDVRGLLLAGIVLGAAGAIDDVTVTQASAVWELKAANPALRAAALFERGIRVGRDHIASTVNTLLLAYAGASLPLLVLFVLSEQSLGTVANSEVVAVEIVRTLVGSIGLVAAVPFTTWLAAVTADGRHAPSH